MLVLVVAVLLAFGYAMFPPQKQLRLGKDLRGGASLVYAVQIRPGEDAQDVLNRTIDALKKRVDPNGLFEISMVAQGRDRIEITMPLPSDEVKNLRKEFEDKLAELGRAALSEARLDRAMRLPADERSAEIVAMAAGQERRAELLREAAARYDAWMALRARYDAADDAAKQAMAAEVAAAEIAYDNARNAVLATALSAEEVRRVVQQSTLARTVVEGKEVFALPSPRQSAEQHLRDAHPDAINVIDDLLDTYDAYAAQRTTLDDPEDLVRLLKGAGVLSFRIMPRPGEHPEEDRLRRELRELGPLNVRSTDARWYKVNQIESWLNTRSSAELLLSQPDYAAEYFASSYGLIGESFAGDYYILAWDTRNTRLTPAEGEWSVASARRGVDPLGLPAIDFTMDPRGARLLGQLTGANVGKPMGILLDDQVYTAPTLNSAISSSGQITGRFSEEEIQYVVRVLGGGALQAKLSPNPISRNAVGPQLGYDNLQKGLFAGIVSLILVAGFMIVYYFGFGVVAVLALACNAVLILGAMAISKAAFTMPGIAGVILTFGMAVDSNVLIYERIREETVRGVDLKKAVRLGFDKALSSIVDGNVTNLIVCVVLYYTATPEIRGFAITMGIGVVSTLFSALVISRLIFTLALDAGWRSSAMLPTAIPGLQKALEPNWNWLRWRKVFFLISTAYVVLGLVMVATRGEEMLDNEFRGGTQVTLQFKPGADGSPGTMPRPEVDQRVQEIAAANPQSAQLSLLKSASVFPIEPQADGVTSDRFVIKTVATNAETIVAAIIEKFADKLEVQPPISFVGDELPAREAPVFPIERPILGADIDRPTVRNDVTPFLGGVAIVMENIDPPQPLNTIRDRLRRTRETTEFSDTLARQRELFVIGGTPEAVTSLALVVRDDAVSLFENPAQWETQVRNREWQLVQQALTTPVTPASVHNFSPAIAATFRAQAIAAVVLSFLFIGIYIWVRFKTPRYGMAAIIALVHDVLTVVGLIALCEILYDHDSTRGFAQWAMLLPFKIDLNLLAALLTIAGYSLNDTVVIMDRIRENKGKLTHASASIINTSINQTLSRTIITGGTTLGSCIILYFVGGEGMRAFAFALTAGLLVGTYSSVAVAAPIVWSRRKEGTPAEEDVPATAATA